MSSFVIHLSHAVSHDFEDDENCLFMMFLVFI